MRKTIRIIAILLFPTALYAQNDGLRPEVRETGGRPEKQISIREVPIWGRRPMKEIGIERTTLDSAVLKENIALSIADVLTFNSPSSSTAGRRSRRSRSAARGRRIRRLRGTACASTTRCSA